MGKRERIDKVLSNMGYGSRKDIKKLIKQGRVAVDGKVISNNSIKIDPYNTIIEVDDNLVEYKEFIYLMMNKPKGIVSSTDDTLNTTVVDIIDDKYRIFNPFPVGRLDKDTEGLLILSNDGQLAHKLLSPKKHVNKTYYVEVDGLVKDIHVEKFKEGIILDDGYKTLPGQLEIIDSGPISRVYVTIREGKYHQVKRMFKAIGMKVTYLKRISMGKLKLDNSLLPGEYRELSEKEVEILWES
jgi:16S rRNA pseudouridine516 synthase